MEKTTASLYSLEEVRLKKNIIMRCTPFTEEEKKVLQEIQDRIWYGKKS